MPPCREGRRGVVHRTDASLTLPGKFVGDGDPHVETADDTDSFPAPEDNDDVDAEEGDAFNFLPAPRADVGDDAEVAENNETGDEKDDDEDAGIGEDGDAPSLQPFHEDDVASSLPASRKVFDAGI